jgi:hypothetical protein
MDVINLDTEFTALQPLIQHLRKTGLSWRAAVMDVTYRRSAWKYTPPTI